MDHSPVRQASPVSLTRRSDLRTTEVKMADTIQEAVTLALDDAPERNFRETVDIAINLRDLDLNDP